MTTSTSEPQFTLYTHHTCPAAFKVANVLALLHLPFKPIYIQITRTIKDQKEPWFLELNPNGRLPVLIDHSQKQNGKDFHLWESGAIIHYLLTQYDTKHLLWPTSIFLQSEINQWVHLHLTGQAVIIGQAFWFGYWHSEILPTAYKRYVDETKRILGVLESRLAEPGRSWLVGDTMSIADVSFLAWYEEAFMVDVETEKDFPVVHKWLETMRAIPEIQEGSVGREMIQPKKLWERS